MNGHENSDHELRNNTVWVKGTRNKKMLHWVSYKLDLQLVHVHLSSDIACLLLQTSILTFPISNLHCFILHRLINHGRNVPFVMKQYIRKI